MAQDKSDHRQSCTCVRVSDTERPIPSLSLSGTYAYRYVETAPPRFRGTSGPCSTASGADLGNGCSGPGADEDTQSLLSGWVDARAALVAAWRRVIIRDEVRG